MPFTWKALSSVWLIIFGLFALAASGTITGGRVLLLVLGGLAAPAIILTIAARLRRGSSVMVTADASPVSIADARDLARMDGDQGVMRMMYAFARRYDP
jgi:hypothetical protein